MSKLNHTDDEENVVGNPTVTQAIFDSKFDSIDLTEPDRQTEHAEPDTNVEGPASYNSSTGQNIEWVFLHKDYERPSLTNNSANKRTGQQMIPAWRFEYYLQRLAHHGHIGKSSREARISYLSITILKKHCPVFLASWEKAYDCSTSRLEDVATEMGHAGDPQMVRFLLGKRKSKTYGDKTQITANNDDGGLQKTLIDLGNLSKDERSDIRKLITKASGDNTEATG